MASILVVDDEPILRESLSLILEQAGYQVASAGQAREARQRLQAHPYDLAFLDIRMPEVDGLTLLAELRRQYPHMPVLILTAHATLETAIDAVRHGARDYLLKPIMPEVILTRVRDVLAEQQFPRRQREITTQLKALMAELDQTDAPEAAAAVPPAASDKARFLQRGVLTLDLYTHQVLLKGQPISIPPVTFDYLTTLLRHSPEPVAYKVLVKESQGYELCQAEARGLVRGRMYELRKALEADLRHPQYIITVRNVGYRLVV